METKTKSIYEFKKGDVIVRLEPAKPYSGYYDVLTGVHEPGLRDRSYLGQPLIFIGIANGQIYLKDESEWGLHLRGDKPMNLSIDKWDNGWALYIDPSKLMENEEGLGLNKEQLSKAINEAIEKENYELAAKLQEKLNSLK